MAVNTSHEFFRKSTLHFIMTKCAGNNPTESPPIQPIVNPVIFTRLGGRTYYSPFFCVFSTWLTTTLHNLPAVFSFHKKPLCPLLCPFVFPSYGVKRIEIDFICPETHHTLPERRHSLSDYFAVALRRELPYSSL